VVRLREWISPRSDGRTERIYAALVTELGDEWATVTLVGDAEVHTPLCTPGRTQACYCSDGSSGSRSCLAAGDDFSACDCSPDAGTEEPDAAADASTDVSIDATEAVDATIDTKPP
jgi:hypothetical protein